MYDALRTAWEARVASQHAVENEDVALLVMRLRDALRPDILATGLDTLDDPSQKIRLFTSARDCETCHRAAEAVRPTLPDWLGVCVKFTTFYAYLITT